MTARDPELCRSKTLFAGTVFSSILLFIVVAKLLLPLSPIAAMGSELDQFRYRLLIEKSIPIECRERRGAFLIEFQRLHIRVTEARTGDPSPEELRALRRSVLALAKAAADNVFREDECEALTASLNNTPLPEIP